MIMEVMTEEILQESSFYVQQIHENEEITILNGLRHIKNLVIGNNRHKFHFLSIGIVSRLVSLINSNSYSNDVKIQCVVIIGSFAKKNENMKSLLTYDVINSLFNQLNTDDEIYYESCLRSLRTIILSKDCLIENNIIDKISESIEMILEKIQISSCIEEYTCEIITTCCQVPDYQFIFSTIQAIHSLCVLMMSSKKRIEIKSTEALTALCFNNPPAAKMVLNVTINGTRIIDKLSSMMSRCQATSIQLQAACCVTNIYRCDVMNASHEHIVFYKTMPCLVRMCEPGRDSNERIIGARTIAHLVESELRLQKLAYICEQFPEKLDSFFQRRGFITFDNKQSDASHKNISDHLKTSAFLAYAAILSNDEDLRKCITSDFLVRRLIEGLDNDKEEVRIASLKGLLSLSRSIKVLRTFFPNHEIWRPVLQLSSRSDISPKEIAALCALIANLLLEFSPSRDQLIEGGIIQQILIWLKNCCFDVKRNTLYALTNVTFRSNTSDLNGSDVRNHVDILQLIGSDGLMDLFLLRDDVITLRILDLLCNLLAPINISEFSHFSTSQHVDDVMRKSGNLFIQSLEFVLKVNHLEHLEEIPSQIAIAVTRIIRNITEGDPTKTVAPYILSNQNILLKIVQFSQSSETEVNFHKFFFFLICCF